MSFIPPTHPPAPSFCYCYLLFIYLLLLLFCSILIFSAIFVQLVKEQTLKPQTLEQQKARGRLLETDFYFLVGIVILRRCKFLFMCLCFFSFSGSQRRLLVVSVQTIMARPLTKSHRSIYVRPLRQSRFDLMTRSTLLEFEM